MPEARDIVSTSRYEAAIQLLKEVVDTFDDSTVPDEDWFRRYFILTGDHVILTDSGWSPGECKQSVIDEFGPEAIEDELNAPAEV